MTYKFWESYSFSIPYELQMKFDVRICNVVSKLEMFLENIMIKNIQKEQIKVFLAGSCIKADSFRDIDLIFPNKDDKEDIVNALNEEFFLYENNSSTFKLNDDIFQFVYREKFKDSSLNFLVDGFDFDSTKIAFEAIIYTKTKKVELLKCDIRKEFIDYVQTRKNNLSKVNVNPFVSLQRAIHYLKNGDDVPYSVFLTICFKIAQLDIKQGNEEDFFNKLQGNGKKLEDVKKAISQFVDINKI